MERLNCPICNRNGLLQAKGSGTIKSKLIVCENSDYIHWQIAGHHFLTRTEKNVKEENDLIFSGNEGNFVLN